MCPDGGTSTRVLGMSGSRTVIHGKYSAPKPASDCRGRKPPSGEPPVGSAAAPPPPPPAPPPPPPLLPLLLAPAPLLLAPPPPPPLGRLGAVAVATLVR